jgi:hypothetical protein
MLHAMKSISQSIPSFLNFFIYIDPASGRVLSALAEGHPSLGTRLTVERMIFTKLFEIERHLARASHGRCLDLGLQLAPGGYGAFD